MKQALTRLLMLGVKDVIFFQLSDLKFQITGKYLLDIKKRRTYMTCMKIFYERLAADFATDSDLIALIVIICIWRILVMTLSM